MDGGEIGVVVFIVAGRDGTEVLERIEQPIDGVALPPKPVAEGLWFETMGHGANRRRTDHPDAAI
jgi:hypothetical protein